MNNIDKHLEFKLTEEENKNRNYLDIPIHRDDDDDDDNNNNNNNNNNLQLGIYRKPTQTDATINFTSNHPFEYKLTHKVYRNKQPHLSIRLFTFSIIDTNMVAQNILCSKGKLMNCRESFCM